MYSKGRRIIVK